MTSTTLTIARRDFAATARSKWLWGASLALLVVTVPDFLNVIRWDHVDSGEAAMLRAPLVLVNMVAPLALVVAHRAVVGERESGSLRILFGHPTTRRDFVVGKFLSRAMVTVAILLVGLLGLALAVVSVHGSLTLWSLLVMTGYVSLYGVAWTGVVVGISAAASTRLQAVTAGLGLFLFFGPFQLWDRLAVPLFALVFTGSPSIGFEPLRPSTHPTWYQYVSRLNPMETFDAGRVFLVWLVDPSLSTLGAHAESLFGFAVLAAWCAVPLALGYRRFERADLT